MRQPALKPQDVVVALKVAGTSERPWTIAQLAKELCLSASEVHACIKRCERTGLLQRGEGKVEAARQSLLEFITHGVRYVFPAVLGGVTSGIPTASAAKPLADHLVQPADFSPVWAHPFGTVRGVSLLPLYPTVPDAALQDEALYELLTLVDGIRMGTSRERGLAVDLLQERLA